MLDVERLIIALLLAAIVFLLWRRRTARAEGGRPWFLEMEMAELKPNFLLVVLGVLAFFSVSPLLGVSLPEQVYLVFLGGLIARLNDLLTPKSPPQK